MKLYIIWADAHSDGWGGDISSIFGIYNSMELAQDAIKELKKENDHIKYEISETKLNTINEVVLG